MPYVHGQHALEAARLLDKLKKEARPPENGRARAASALGEAAFRHMSIEKASGVHVYQGDRGGWFADITFDDMPAGVSPCLGTPTHHPLKTRDEAMAAARGLVELVMSLDLARDAAPPASELPDGMAAFLFHGAVVPLPIAMLDALRDQMPFKPDEEYVLDRLDQLTRLLGDPDEVDADKVAAAPPEFVKALIPVAAMALLAGVLRFPQFDEAAPSPMN